MIMIPSQPVALTIAGSDSSGGAGIQADLKTFAALNVHGTSAITCVTAQNRLGVSSAEMLSPELVVEQIKMVSKEFSIAAAKTGMLGTRAIIDAVSEAVRALPDLKLVIDPVIVATSGARLLEEDSVACLKTSLLPQATLITPNLDEAAALLDSPKARTPAEMERQALALRDQTQVAVLVKGGDLKDEENDNENAGTDATASDVLADGQQLTWFTSPFVVDTDAHGTGCTLSAAITAQLAKGETLVSAIEHAKTFVTNALLSARA